MQGPLLFLLNITFTKLFVIVQTRYTFSLGFLKWIPFCAETFGTYLSLFVQLRHCLSSFFAIVEPINGVCIIVKEERFRACVLLSKNQIGFFLP